MFSAANSLSLVLQSDCKNFGFVWRSAASSLHILEDISNDVNIFHFRSSRNYFAKFTQKGEVR